MMTVRFIVIRIAASKAIVVEEMLRFPEWRDRREHVFKVEELLLCEEKSNTGIGQ